MHHTHTYNYFCKTILVFVVVVVAFLQGTYRFQSIADDDRPIRGRDFSGRSPLNRSSIIIIIVIVVTSGIITNIIRRRNAPFDMRKQMMNHIDEAYVTG